MVSRELIAASTRPIILSILTEGESYGYAIIQRVKELSEDQIVWKDGMLYPVLKRLQEEGLIQSEWRDSDAGRRRRYYRIERGGRQELAREKEQWVTVHSTLSKLWGGVPCPA